jgi:hypothetical protein
LRNHFSAFGKNLHTLQEHRDLSPIGMMEYWNNGFWGIEGVGIGKIPPAPLYKGRFEGNAEKKLVRPFKL